MSKADELKRELAELEGRPTPKQDGITDEERAAFHKHLNDSGRCYLGPPSNLEDFVENRRRYAALVREFITDAPTPANENVIPEAAVTPPTVQPEPEPAPEPLRIELTPELIAAYYDEKIAELRRETQK